MWELEASQPYGSPRPVTGIALPLCFVTEVGGEQKIASSVAVSNLGCLARNPSLISFSYTEAS
jgi:hypothetical protein